MRETATAKALTRLPRLERSASVMQYPRSTIGTTYPGIGFKEQKVPGGTWNLTFNDALARTGWHMCAVADIFGDITSVMGEFGVLHGYVTTAGAGLRIRLCRHGRHDA